MHATIINNRGCEFERAQGEVYGRVWRDQMESGNYITVS